jgi:integrase/recombinase XerD
MLMSTASVSLFIDRYHPKQDSTCGVSIRVTHLRSKKYYPTGISLKPEIFDKIIVSKRKTEEINKMYLKLNSFLTKAINAANSLTIFTFNKFEEIYLSNREASDTVSFGFSKYIEQLKQEKRIGTAISYECAKTSLDKFKPRIKYADVTPSLLRKYENWMIEKGNSLTTVGIYLRSLRTIFNRANVDKALYPFGEKKDKYSIPTSRNIKKSLTLEEIASIFQYKAIPGSSEEMARDYWIFLYLCNGMNVKDFCLLKHKNIDGDILIYHREKTKRSKSDQIPSVVSLKKQSKEIIKKWGQKSIVSEAYIFPHVRKGMTEVQIRLTVQQLIKTINKYMKRIASNLEIHKPITTYYARHSFATVLKNSGASIEFISEALAHSSQKTTKSYLSGFENDAIHKTTDALLNFSK